MTTLDDPCQGILLEQPTQIELSRKTVASNKSTQDRNNGIYTIKTVNS